MRTVYFFSLFVSAGALEWQPKYFTTILLYYAPVNVASVLVIFVS